MGKVKAYLYHAECSQGQEGQRKHRQTFDWIDAPTALTPECKTHSREMKEWVENAAVVGVLTNRKSQSLL